MVPAPKNHLAHCFFEILVLFKYSIRQEGPLLIQETLNNREKKCVRQ